MSHLASTAQPYADHLIEGLRRAGAIQSPAVSDALRIVPRHWFTPTLEPAEGQRLVVDPDDPSPPLLRTVYADAPLVVSRDPLAQSPQPRVVARLLAAADLRPGHRVALLGEQTGWVAALVGQIIGEHGMVRVSQLSPAQAVIIQHALDRMRHPGMRVVTRALVDGIVEDAPYHRLLVLRGCGEVAPAWLDQVAPGGALLVPVFLAWLGVVLRLQRTAIGWSAGLTQVARFPAADGALAPDDIDPLTADNTPELAELFARPGREAALALPDSAAPDPWGHAETFALFLATHDPRCVLVQGPDTEAGALRFGLWDRAGGSLALYSPEQQMAAAYGESPLALLQLRTHHTAWMERGFPGCDAYQVAVDPGDVSGPGEGGWRADERGATLPLGALTLRVTLA